MRFSKGHILEYNLKLKKIKRCHPEEINNGYDGKNKNKLLKEIMHNKSEFELSKFELSEFELSYTP